MTTPVYTWTITALDTFKSVGTSTNVVAAASWRCTYGIDAGYAVFLEGKCYFGPPAARQFKPFDQLTQAEVIDWVQNEMWTDTVEAILKERYDTLAHTVPDAPKVVDQMVMRPIMWGG